MDRLIGLVLLRWTLERRGLRRTPERVAALVLLVPLLLVSAGIAAVFAFVGTRMLAASSPDLLLPALSAAATMVGVFWMVSPLLTGLALTETHDLTRLLHFPITFPSLVIASLAANLLQPLVLAKLPIAVALAAAVAPRTSTLPLAVVGMLLAFAFMLAAVQLSGLLIVGAARNRRFQDLALFVGLGVGFALSMAPLLLFTAGPGPLRVLRRFFLDTDVFALSPFAWGVRAAIHGGRGEIGPFALHSLASLIAIAGAVALSTVLIHRIHGGELNLAGGKAGAGVRARMRFASPLGALVEKDLRAAWRDPALKAGLLISLTGPLLFAIFFVSAARGRTAPILMLAAFVGLSVFGTNTFGLERRGVALLMAFPVERWRILVAKNLAAMVLRLPGLLMLMVVGLLLAPLSLLPAALTIALVGLLLSAAVDNYASILFPVPAPEPGRMPAGGGRGLAALVISGLLLTGALVAASPFMLLAYLPLGLGQRWLWLISLPLALAGAAAVYAMLIAGAERLLRRRERDMLERILTIEAA